MPPALAFFLVVLALSIIGFILLVVFAVCVRSAQISRMEERPRYVRVAPSSTSWCTVDQLVGKQ